AVGVIGRHSLRSPAMSFVVPIDHLSCCRALLTQTCRPGLHPHDQFSCYLPDRRNVCEHMIVSQPFTKARNGGGPGTVRMLPEMCRSWGTLTNVRAEARLPTLSVALMIMVYKRPSLSFP